MEVLCLLLSGWGIPQRSSHPFVCQRQQVSFFIKYGHQLIFPLFTLETRHWTIDFYNGLEWFSELSEMNWGCYLWKMLLWCHFEQKNCKTLNRIGDHIHPFSIINVDCGQFKRRITRKLKNVALKVCSVPDAPLKKTSLVVLSKIVSHLLLDAQLKLSQEPTSNVFSLFTGATFFQENTQFSFPSLKTPTASDLKKMSVELVCLWRANVQHNTVLTESDLETKKPDMKLIPVLLIYLWKNITLH